MSSWIHQWVGEQLVNRKWAIWTRSTPGAPRHNGPVPQDRWGSAGRSAEVALIVSIMTLQHRALKAEVGVRELHDQLSRYLRHVGSGGDVVVTMRGRRVVRLSKVDDADPLSDLRARGLVSEPQRPRRHARGRELLTTDGSVSDLVSEQRR